jgi:hypothetical protein
MPFLHKRLEAQKAKGLKPTPKREKTAELEKVFVWWSAP